MLLRWRVGDNEASGIVEEPIVSRWSVGEECVTGTCCRIRTTDSVLSSLTHPHCGPPLMVDPTPVHLGNIIPTFHFPFMTP